MKIENLANSISYQKDSIVSRELAKKEGGTATLFAFDKGQGLSEHTSPFDALLYVLEGAVRAVVSGKEYFVRQGDMIVMPASEPHSLSAGQRFKMLLVMIRG